METQQLNSRECFFCGRSAVGLDLYYYPPHLYCEDCRHHAEAENKE